MISVALFEVSVTTTVTSNELSEEKLADLIYLYGEEKLSRRIARAIVQARAGGKIQEIRK